MLFQQAMLDSGLRHPSAIAPRQQVHLKAPRANFKSLASNTKGLDLQCCK